MRAPEPEDDDVDLLRALDYAGTEAPGCCGYAAWKGVSGRDVGRRGKLEWEGWELTFAAEVQGEEECAAGRSQSVECCGYILYPALGELGLAIGRQAEQKECKAVEGEWD